MSDLKLIAKVAFVAALFGVAAALSGCASNIKQMAALDGGARDGNPQVAARAQRAFDCWNHEAEEDNWYESITDDHVKPCRDEFNAAMAQLAPPMQKMENPNEYIVLFDFDKSN